MNGTMCIQPLGPSPLCCPISTWEKVLDSCNWNMLVV